MTFLFYRYNSICEPDMIEGFQALGHEVDTIELEMARKDVSGQQIVAVLQGALGRRSYDGIVTVNYYPVISEVCRIYGVCYYAWMVDCPVLELLSDTISNPTNRIFCFDYMQYSEIVSYHPNGIFYLPLATNAARWGKLIAGTPAGEQARWKSDISFVGSLYTEKCPYDDLLDPPAYLSGFLCGLMEAQKQLYGAFLLEDALTDEIAEEFIKHTRNFYQIPEKARQDKKWVIAMQYLGMKVTSMERMDVMRLLGSEFPVDLYTGSSTKGLPIRNRGFARTLTEMPLIFHNSRINLNITCKSIRSGLSQRIWDIMGAGGFVLTNYQAEVAEYFKPGEEIEMYGSMEELAEKCRYYLEHDEVRRKIALRGCRSVAEKHTYKNRISEMLRLAKQ